MTTDQHDARKAGALELRDELRRIMRGERSENAIAVDLIREVSEWHAEGRPDVDETIRRIKEAREPATKTGDCPGCGDFRTLYEGPDGDFFCQDCRPCCPPCCCDRCKCSCHI